MLALVKILFQSAYVERIDRLGFEFERLRRFCILAQFTVAKRSPACPN
jgi:hypothetical protein